jgi:hypothetical protein
MAEGDSTFPIHESRLRGRYIDVQEESGSSRVREVRERERERAHTDARWAFLDHPLLFWMTPEYAMTRPYQLPSGMSWGGNSWCWSANCFVCTVRAKSIIIVEMARHKFGILISALMNRRHARSRSGEATAPRIRQGSHRLPFQDFLKNDKTLIGHGASSLSLHSQWDLVSPT